MIRDYFGITTGNFVKMLVLVAFIFFFFRIAHLFILFTQGKSRKELKYLIIFTEIISWLALISWTIFIVPFKNLELVGIAVVFNVLNFIFWKNIKESVALFLIKKIVSPEKSKRVKIDNKIFKIYKFSHNSIFLMYNSEKREHRYTKFLKNNFTFSENKEITKTTNENLKEKGQLYATLKENDFINKNTEVEIILKDKKFQISIDSFDKTELEKTETFINKIF